MDLEQINLKKLQSLKGKQKEKKILEFQQKKEILIEKYVKMQDLLDEYNQKMYHLSCEIEQINIVLAAIAPKKATKK